MDLPEFINDEWRDALVKVWPMSEPNEQGEANVTMTLRLGDPVALLEDIIQYVDAIHAYYKALMGGGTPVVELERAHATLGDAHWYLIDSDYEPPEDPHTPDIKPEDFT